MTDQDPVRGPVRGCDATGEVEYIPPEGSIETRPPYGSPEITRWMVIGGRRVKRHASHTEAWRAANKKIMKAAIFMLVAFATIMVAFFALFGGLLASASFLFSPQAAMIAAIVIAVSVALAAILAVLFPQLYPDPLNVVRDRYDLAHDEFILSFLIVIAVLLPVGLLVHHTVGG